MAYLRMDLRMEYSFPFFLQCDHPGPVVAEVSTFELR